MSATTFRYRFRLEGFLRARDAGALDERTELIDGDIWAVPVGDWHAATAMSVARALPTDRVVLADSSLPAGDSLLLPDCWVRRADTEPVAVLSPSPPTPDTGCTAPRSASRCLTPTARRSRWTT